MNQKKKAGLLIMMAAAGCLGGDSLIAQGENFRLGGMTFDLRGSTGLVYNSNLSRSRDDKVSDWIAQAGINLSGKWDITELNRLSISIGARYDKYFSNSELDSSRTFLTLSPDTEVSFQFIVGNFAFRVFDRLSFSSDPGQGRFVDPNTGVLSTNVIAFNRFTNVFGVGGTWAIHPAWQAGMEVRREDVRPLDSEFDFLQRSETSLSGSLTHLYAANMRFGVNGGASSFRYSENFQRDGNSWNGGVFVEWEPTQVIDTRLSLGYYQSDFDNQPGGNLDFSNPSGYITSFLLRHYVRTDLEHSLLISRNIGLGNVSNTVTITDFAYRIAYLGFERSAIRGSVNYTRGNESGGPLAEKYRTWIFGADTGYALSSQLDFRVSYQFTTADSNIGFRNYNQHIVRLGFDYDF